AELLGSQELATTLPAGCTVRLPDPPDCRKPPMRAVEIVCRDLELSQQLEERLGCDARVPVILAHDHLHAAQRRARLEDGVLRSLDVQLEYVDVPQLGDDGIQRHAWSGLAGVTRGLCPGQVDRSCPARTTDGTHYALALMGRDGCVPDLDIWNTRDIASSQTVGVGHGLISHYTCSRIPAMELQERDTDVGAEINYQRGICGQCVELVHVTDQHFMNHQHLRVVSYQHRPEPGDCHSDRASPKCRYLLLGRHQDFENCRAPRLATRGCDRSELQAPPQHVPRKGCGGPDPGCYD